ncbi:glycosyltransferase [Paenibacillus sp. HWE-109]|uniref:glycosyltransferase n=1 Tax=Paenibacillus sp. HWE-109 TaxID=1306526 RepID=UPI001EDEBAAF|nr:glycosyltransferase [Paenibacillus sp. HWE-109]UKS24981.1 glycosyltransferase [Paenibacillus sp. HWE-109]
MKIGIFLTYKPNTVLTSEGLGRYLASLVKGFVDTDNEVVIACPEWLENTLNLLFEDYRINKKSVTLVTVSQPISIRFMMLLGKRKKQERKSKGKIKRLVSNLLFETLNNVLSITNAILFFTVLLVGVILVTGLLPFFLVSLIIVLIMQLIRKFIKRPKDKFNLYMNRTFIKKIVISVLLRIFTWTQKPGYSLYEAVINKNIEKLINKINLIEPVDIWYSPNAFPTMFEKINGVKVINVPDLVTAVYPQRFLDMSPLLQTEKIRNVIKSSSYFITYSSYIKKTIVIDDFMKKDENIKVIEHATNDLSSYIDIYSNSKHLDYPYNVNFVFARQQLNLLKVKASLPILPHIHEYVANLNFKDVKYIFYSSQIRPHKNIINLLKAYEYVLRRKFKQVKLILTGKYSADEEVKKFILEKRLQYDVLSFSNVSSQMLACLYACAELVVNPTLYEGGFPFTLTEGLSVGTPSVMSRIPQVLEKLGDEDSEDYLFDPYNWKDIAEKIIYGLENKDNLYERQNKIYQKMKERTITVMAHEYVDAFKYFIDKSAHQKD